ncbi:hypothetical protein OUZ56_021757 [Daphnia magna]|uniref:Uncharacterized protein n=1 Tax=Daphnia magna TaxID=35525 RepID=A0ABR0AUC0_9CRUS|nr:hypothetical protein OUZ56_021757 [Daphnia magna]
MKYITQADNALFALTLRPSRSLLSGGGVLLSGIKYYITIIGVLLSGDGVLLSDRGVQLGGGGSNAYGVLL